MNLANKPTCLYLAPHRHTIGMLEYWKVGIMGCGKMEKWAIAGFLIKIKLPLFQA